ncbi:MAG: protein jag [Lachnospiraceae bacterium]|jgi:spoIIIJ-associated protein|nr:protein jag [Lachnospiraceae bacterium]
MDYITVSEKTVEDAITEASVQLGIPSNELEYEVIEKGSAGFLGLGMKQAVIRARRKHAERSTGEREAKKAPRKEYQKDYQKDQKRSNQKSRGNDQKPPYKKEGNKDYQKNHKPRETKEFNEVKKSAPIEAVVLKKEEPLAKVEETTISACKKFLAEVLLKMGMEGVKIESRIDDEGALNFELAGENMGLLIGKRGQTLDALQYLTNRVANKMQEGYVRVKIDTEDYRKRRQETLEILAKRIAGKVKRSRRTVVLEPMNPYERRIIHSTLQSDTAISTHSEGEEPYRKVVVTLNRR